MIQEMKVADVRNWVLNNTFNNGNPSNHDVWFADMLKDKYSVGPVGSTRTLDGAWLTVGEVKQLFMTHFDDHEWGFRVLEADVITYWKYNY